MRNKQPLSPETALVRLETLCARSEQCTWELSEKLKKWGISAEESTKIISSLQKRRFVDNERYTRAFVRDRFRFAGWGPYKIRQSLRLKRIPDDLIENALRELDGEEINRALRTLLRRRAEGLDLCEQKERARLLRLAVSRGFAPSKALEIIKQISQNELHNRN